MRIGILSDLHVDLNHSETDIPIEEALARAVEERQVERMIIAGDLTNDWETTLEALDRIERMTSVPCLFVPGNHDVWNINAPGRSAWEAYDKLKEFPRNLANGAFRLTDHWVVIGDLGWYDYSFASPDFTFEQLERMQWGERTWKDSLYADWGMSVGQVHNYFVEKLKRQLDEHRGSSIILVTHVVPHKAFTVPETIGEWRYFNGFLGSRQYGELIRDYSDSIRYAVSGHVHYRKEVEENGVRLLNNGLGYRREWRSGQGAMEEVKRALLTIDLD
ncbi:metallophosphoesterase [Paenibacillus residui]|uniref:Metallophosphoesterase n=1 Tax=Paenibacillus residui TaxID=629724 RepID=A0ABW3DHL8_9BACL